MEEKKKYGHYIFIAILFAVIAIPSYFIINWSKSSDLFILKKVKIEGNNFVTDEEILKLASIKISDKLYEVDITSRQKRISENPFIKGVTITRNPPSTLVITIIEREPVFFLNETDLYPVDNEGYIMPHLKIGKMYDLPIVSGIKVKEKKFGEKNKDTKINQTILLLEKIKEIDKNLYHIISEIHFDKNEEIRLHLIKGGSEIVVGKNDFLKKFVYLGGFLRELNKETEINKIDYIDLRFENQIVVKFKV
jgi:cell division protein FtsQ